MLESSATPFNDLLAPPSAELSLTGEKNFLELSVPPPTDSFELSMLPSIRANELLEKSVPLKMGASGLLKTSLSPAALIIGGLMYPGVARPEGLW